MMVELRNMSFAYRGQPPLYEGFDLFVRRGESWSIIGPSGCGKTTLLYLLAGLLHPTGGSIGVDGHPIRRPRPSTGLVLQDHGLLPWATVRENARLGFSIRMFYGPDGKHAPKAPKTGKIVAEREIDYWLQRLGIETFQDKYPSQLSRGQRQRTALARTLALSPDLLLMDEPFSALDAGIREDLQNLMIGFHRESNLTSILVTHEIEEAVFVGEKILVLSGETNREPHIVSNDVAGRPGDRNQPAFRDLCDKLRLLIGGLT